MRLRAWVMLVAAVLATLSIPVVTAHTIVSLPLLDTGAGHATSLHLDVMPLLALTAASLVPLVGLVRGAIRWLTAERRLHVLTRGGIRRASGNISYVSLPGEQVTLFTAGVVRPVVYATTGAERMLSPAAFHAALLHEQAHVRNHDVQWLVLVALAEAAVAVFPGARDVFRSLRTETEWRADQAALKAGADRRDLFEAIVSAAGGTAGAAALSGAGTAERLRWLAEMTDNRPVDEPSVGPVLAGLFVPPVIAHLLLWTGLVCAACLQHLH